MINTAGLHPIIADVFRAAAALPVSAERAGYIAALHTHDWAHEFSDDGNVYRRGRAELKALREQQQRIDRDWRIWNSLAPKQCVNGTSYS